MENNQDPIFSGAITLQFQVIRIQHIQYHFSTNKSRIGSSLKHSNRMKTFFSVELGK